MSFLIDKYLIEDLAVGLLIILIILRDRMIIIIEEVLQEKMEIKNLRYRCHLRKN